jgi:DNA-binding transcriptional LysR family regulator
MEHRQLINFITVCEEKSFAKAAIRLFISPQGLSKSIKNLEQNLDVPLFFRTRKGVQLTEFGKILEKTVRSYLNQHNQITTTIRQLKDKAKSHLSIGIAVSTVAVFPTGFFKRFILDHPEITLELRSFPDDACLQSVLDHNMQICCTPAPIDKNSFESVYSERKKLYLIAGKNHPLAAFPSITLKDIWKETIITLNTQTSPQSLIEELCRQNGFGPRIFLNGSENKLLVELLETGQIMSFYGAPPGVFPDPNLAWIEIEDLDIYWEFHLAINKNTYINKAAEQFIAYTRKELADRS